MGVVFNDHSKEVLEKSQEALKKALTAIGMSAEGHAKKETPVDTGRLRNSIANVAKDDSVYIGTNVEYAAYV